MSDLTYKCDRKSKPFAYRGEVPAKVLANQFDHLDEDDSFDGFLCYRGYWYHLSDFMRSESVFAGAPIRVDGYHSDSFFSGVVIEVANDGESYRVATYFS